MPVSRIATRTPAPVKPASCASGCVGCRARMRSDAGGRCLRGNMDRAIGDDRAHGGVARQRRRGLGGAVEGEAFERMTVDVVDLAASRLGQTLRLTLGVVARSKRDDPGVCPRRRPEQAGRRWTSSSGPAAWTGITKTTMAMTAISTERRRIPLSSARLGAGISAEPGRQCGLRCSASQYAEVRCGTASRYGPGILGRVRTLAAAGRLG